MSSMQSGSSSRSSSQDAGSDGGGSSWGRHSTGLPSPIAEVELAASPLTAAPTADDSAGAGLQAKERIHRYLDQCIPPSLVAHQRTRDGPVLVQLCAALRDFGAPREWAPFLPISAVEEDEDGDGAVVEVEAGHGGGTERAEARHRFTHLAPPPAAPFDVFSAPLYAAECVPFPPHPTLAELRAAAATSTTAPVVKWSALARHLSYLAARLTDLLKAPPGAVGAYTLPPRLQAWVVPPLYAWLTYWPLIEADIPCWDAVVRCFHAACRPPPRAANAKPAAAAAAAAAAASTAGNAGADSAPPAVAEAEDGAGDGDTAAAWAYTLPWRPLALLCFSVQDSGNAAVPAWLNALRSVAAALPRLCRRAVSRFDAAAVEGLWGLVADRLATTVDGAAALSIFVQLVPYRHLCTAATPGAPPQPTPHAWHVLRFLFVETALVPPRRRPTPALQTPASAGEGKAPPGQRGKTAMAAFFVTWAQAAMLFAGRLARAHPGVAGLDALAEPLFTAWLRSMELSSPAAQGRGGGGGGGHGGGGKGGEPAKQRPAAGPHVRLLNAFADDVDTPLWRQLERWVHATRVFVRPGLPCTKGSPADRVCGCYSELAREALRRCPRRRAADAQGTAAEGDGARYWGPATVRRFVELLLPCAVAAFQVRARHAFALLGALLRLDPAAVLPEYLTCVETGLESPTEVAAQRAASTRLLTCAVPTLLADAGTAAAPSDVAACRDTLHGFLRARLPSLLALVNPSALVGALPVLTLTAVAVSYTSIDALFGTTDAVVDFAKVYTAQLIPLYAAHADAATGHYREADVVVRAFLQALPPPALSVAAHAILREAQVRDHGARLAGLVRMVAACAPAAAWACTERHWLPVLTDPTSRDGAVEWAAKLLAACVSQLGDRAIVRANAGAVWHAAQLQLRFLTSKTRRAAAQDVGAALLTSLVLPRETSANCFRAPRDKPTCEGAGHMAEEGTGGADGSRTRNDEAAAQTSPVSPPRPRMVGAAEDARVYVEWATADDVQTAAAFFNTAITACVQLVTDLDSEAATAADLPALLHRFLGASVPAPSAADALVCESAGAVSRRSLLDGVLEWMLVLLWTCEWMYVAPTDAAAVAATATTGAAADDCGARGVAWWKMSLHATWCPTAAAAQFGAEARCTPAYSRDALCEVLRRHVCQPMLQRQVVAPLRGAGVELGPWLPLPATASSSPTPASTSSSPPPPSAAGAEDGAAEVKDLLSLLEWLASPEVRHPRLLWRPAPSLWHFLRRSLGRQCPWVRRRLPLRCWVERAMQLQIEAVVHGQLPVTQRCFSDVITTLQGLCLSPHRTTWSAAVQRLVKVRMFGDLDIASVAVLEARTRAMATDVMVQWRRTAAASPGSTAVHTVQQSVEGVLTLFVSLLLNREFFEAPVACLHLLRFLVHFPEELRSVTAGLVLPHLLETIRRSQIAVSGTVRSAAFVAAVVQLAYELAATYPARAALLLGFARVVYWPSPRHWLALRAVRQLTRLSTGVHVVLRCMAADVLYIAAVAVMPRDATVTVCATGPLVPPPPPASFALSAEALRTAPLSAEEQRTHAAAVAAVQATLRCVAAVAPFWAFDVGTTGIVFPHRYINLPRRVAHAAGLQPVGTDAPEHACALVAPTFADVLVAASPPPAAAAAYRREWRAALLGSMDGGAAADRDPAATAVGAGAPAPPAAAASELSAQSWLLRLLAIPVEMAAAGSGTQVAPPNLIAALLMSLSEDAPASAATASVTPAAAAEADVVPSVTDAALLLAWAEGGLRRWRGTPRRGGVITKAHLPESGAMPGSAVAAAEDSAPVSCTPDELYRAFSRLAMVLCVVLRLTAPHLRTATSSTVSSEGTPKSGGARDVAADEVHRRAVRCYTETLACVCGDAAIPHGVAEMVVLVSVQTLRRSLSPEELLAVVCDLAAQLLASGTRDAAAAEEGLGGGADTWSQQQVRVLLFFAVLLHSTPPAVVGLLLPRLTAMIGAHADVFFTSPSDQVRLAASRVITHLLSLATLASPLRVELSTCDAVAGALLCSLLRRVNADVFGGRLPLRCEAAADGAVSAAAWPDPSTFGAATTRDAALLTVAAYCFGDLWLPVLQPHLGDVVAVLCYSLDLSFTEVQSAHDAAADALLSLVALRMPKALVQQCIDELCAVCTGAAPYGQSRRALAACTQALHRLIFPNLHRIGRFAVVEQVAAASLAALAHRDASVRAAGSELMAVLTKVAAEAQTRVLVQRLTQELRELPRQTAPTADAAPQMPTAAVAEEDGEAPLSTAAVAPGAAPLSRRVALVQALGAVLLADPGTPPSYVPRLMGQLAGCAREGNTECGRVAKRVFESWWRAHREGWAREYKACFTQAQVDAIADLFVAPLYFA